MKTAMLASLVCAALLLPASAAMAATAASDASDARKLAVAKTKSLAEKGSYHVLHKKQKLACADCHARKALPDSTLMLRLHEPLAKGSPGPVNSDSCHECHGKAQKKPVTWYAAKEVKD